MSKPRHAKKILIISNMFPNEKYPSYGIFVKKFCTEVKECIDPDLRLCVIKGKPNKYNKILKYIIFYLKSFFYALLWNYDLIYIHYASHSSLGIIAASKFKKIKVYVNVHGSDIVPENVSQQRFQKYTEQILKIASKVIVPSEYFANVVSDKYNIEKNKISVYPSGGVNTHIFYPCKDVNEKERLKQKYGLDPNKRYIGCVGRMIEGKGWNTFINAIIPVINEFNDVNVIIVGSGPQKEEILKEVNDFILDNRITYYPLLSQIKLSEVYRIIDFFVFPTEREGESLGLVALESMACGTLIISSDFAAPKYYIKDHVNGLKFEVGNSTDLLKKIKFALNMNMKQYYSIVLQGLRTAAVYSDVNSRNTLKSIMEDV